MSAYKKALHGAANRGPVSTSEMVDTLNRLSDKKVMIDAATLAVLIAASTSALVAEIHSPEKERVIVQACENASKLFSQN